MQGKQFREPFQISIEQVMAIEDEVIYDQYKQERHRYQQMEAVEQLVNNQISRFPQCDDFRQSALQFYDLVSKKRPKVPLSKKQPLELSEDESKDGIKYLFVFDGKKNELKKVTSQHWSQKTLFNQSKIQYGKNIFAQINTLEMQKCTKALFESLQNEIEPGQQKKIIPYLQSRNSTIGMLRKVMRDCIKTSLVYEHYLEQISQGFKHQDNCCQRQKNIMNKIYEMQTQAINSLHPEGKQPLLKQVLAENSDLVFSKISGLQTGKKAQKTTQKS